MAGYTPTRGLDRTIGRFRRPTVGGVDKSWVNWMKQSASADRRPERPVPPASVWQAMARPDFLVSGLPWRSLCYLATGVLFGAGAAVLLLTLVAVGMVLSVALVGVPLLAAVCLAGVPLCALERRRVGWLGAEPVPDPHARVARPGFPAWLRFRLSEQATWRELGYAFLLCLLWPVDLAVLFLGVILPGGILYAAVTVLAGLNPMVRPLPGWSVDSAGQAAALVPLSLLAFLAGAYLMVAAAGSRAALTRVALGARDADGGRLVELTRSRARLLDAFEAERRRIERDLHDGAQQRLLALTMTLGLARIAEDGALDSLLADAQQQARRALQELRELIRGIHPLVLTDRGLPAAVADVADRLTISVSTDFDLPVRLSQQVESVAYFVVCEALANVTRHSGADRAEVTGRLREDLLTVEIRDNGSGGADTAAGTGLAGLADRLSVVEGRLHISSPPGGPTVLRAEIPAVMPAGVGLAG
jgi:signal transduction histidine kinase